MRILARIEQLFRQERQQPNLVLADEFDMFAGTSTGAIIAAGLCWGLSVSEIEDLYVAKAAQMFTRAPWLERWRYKFRSEILAAIFQQIFHEDPAGEQPALLGSQKLRKLLLVVMRNATTGSVWPVTNNPHARFNDFALDDCNLNIPLWQLLRASTAAPSFYAPEAICLGEQTFLFLDGAITPYNNPALIAALTATLPAYHVDWSATPENLLVISVGTGIIPARLQKLLPRQVHLLDHATYVPPALISGIATEQDLLCRVLGRCLHGPPLDLELGDMLRPTLLGPSEQKFCYARYDARLDLLENNRSTQKTLKFALDDITLIPWYQEFGSIYAEEHVQSEHLMMDKEVA